MTFLILKKKSKIKTLGFQGSIYSKVKEKLNRNKTGLELITTEASGGNLRVITQPVFLVC